jgi:predicted RNA-binding protein with PUA-like domain
MAYWLLKSEPDEFGWPDLIRRGDAGEDWTGVRNYQARNNMRAMSVGDLGFFYHSNIGKEIVGILEVIRTVVPDPSADDPRWECVRVKAARPFARPVTLEQCKQTPELSDMALVRRPRLSVQPVTPEEWQIICKMGQVDP